MEQLQLGNLERSSRSPLPPAQRLHEGPSVVEWSPGAGADSLALLSPSLHGSSEYLSRTTAAVCRD